MTFGEGFKASYSSLLTIHYSPFTIHYSLLITHYSLLISHSMTFTAHITVMPLKELLDPQGKAVTGSLHNLGLAGVHDAVSAAFAPVLHLPD